MALIGQHQQTTFANPQNGQAPDADVIRANDNATVAKHNSHDADATIHIQTGPLASRPAAGTAGAVYVDENRRMYVDNGTAWAEVPYARLDAVGTNAFTNNVTVGGTLGVTGTTTMSTVNATTLNGTHTGTGTGLTGLDASNLASGTVPDARFPATLPAVSGANLTSLNASNISSGTIASARLPATIAANTTGSAQSVVNGSHSLNLAGGTVLTIPSGSGSGLTGVNYTVGAFQQGPNGFPTFSAQAAFIPVTIAGVNYFIRCERWT